MEKRIFISVLAIMILCLGCTKGTDKQSRQFEKQARFGTFTEDDDEVKLNLSAFYQLNSDSLKLFNDKGFFADKNDSIDVVGLFVEPIMRSVARTVLKKYTSKELYEADKHDIQQELWQEAKKLMAGNQTKYQFEVQFNDFILMEEIKYPHIVNEAKEDNLLGDLELLNSASRTQRQIAIENLLKNGSETAYKLILEHWSKEKDAKIRANILKGLADRKQTESTKFAPSK